MFGKTSFTWRPSSFFFFCPYVYRISLEPLHRFPRNFHTTRVPSLWRSLLMDDSIWPPDPRWPPFIPIYKNPCNSVNFHRNDSEQSANPTKVTSGFQMSYSKMIQHGRHMAAITPQITQIPQICRTFTKIAQNMCAGPLSKPFEPRFNMAAGYKMAANCINHSSSIQSHRS